MTALAQQIAPDPMSPGTYLRKRREAAGLGLRQAAANLAALGLSFARGRASLADDRTVARVALRLNLAEDDELPFPTDEAEFVANAFPFDAQVYSQLVALHYAGPPTSTSAPRRALNDTAALVRLPVPRLCIRCACSAQDACMDDHGGCAWSAQRPDICTACQRKADAVKDLRAPEPILTVIASIRFGGASNQTRARPNQRAKSPAQCFAYWDGEAMVCNAGPSGNCCGNPPRPPAPGARTAHRRLAPAARG